MIRNLARVLAVAATIVVQTGCDNITGLDNRPAPSSTITGRIMFQGEPVGVRTGGVELELWEPLYEELYGEREKIEINVAQDGTFAAEVFDGDYELNLLANNGPWVNDPTVYQIQLRGSTDIDIPVTPYYTIEDPTYTRGAPTGESPGGTITATFRVGQIDTSRPVEWVGLYIGVTSIVDRNNSVGIPNAERERSGSSIEAELNGNQTISITVTLPEDIYESDSPWIRDFVFARVGVKTSGVGEMLFSPIFEVGI